MRALKRLDVAVLIILFFLIFPCFGQDYDTYMKRGIAYSNKGQYDKAISDFTKAIELNPSEETAYVHRAIAWAKKDQYAEAFIDRGFQHYFKGQYDMACSDWKRACELGACENYEREKRNGNCK